MTPHSLTNFEIQQCYQKEPEINGVYSRNNLYKIKHGAYITNLDEYESTGTHYIALYTNAKSVTYFDSFGVEYIPKEFRKLIRNKNIDRIQVCDSIMCRYFVLDLLIPC